MSDSTHDYYFVVFVFTFTQHQAVLRPGVFAAPKARCREGAGPSVIGAKATRGLKLAQKMRRHRIGAENRTLTHRRLCGPMRAS